MEGKKNQFGFQQNAECTRTCRAFRASRRFAASRPPRDFTLSVVDRQDTKSTTRADLLQRSQLGCMSDQGSFASISSCPLPSPLSTIADNPPGSIEDRAEVGGDSEF